MCRKRLDRQGKSLKQKKEQNDEEDIHHKFEKLKIEMGQVNVQLALLKEENNVLKK